MALSNEIKTILKTECVEAVRNGHQIGLERQRELAETHNQPFEQVKVIEWK